MTSWKYLNDECVLKCFVIKQNVLVISFSHETFQQKVYVQRLLNKVLTNQITIYVYRKWLLPTFATSTTQMMIMSRIGTIGIKTNQNVLISWLALFCCRFCSWGFHYAVQTNGSSSSDQINTSNFKWSRKKEIKNKR